MNEDSYHLGIKALIRNGEGKILLLKVNNKKLVNENNVYWDIPGGRIKRNHTVEQTLQREVEEETGLKNIKIIGPVSMVLSNIRIPVADSDVGLILNIYECQAGNSGNIICSDEHVDYSWFSPQEASQLLKYKYPKEFISAVAVL